MTNNDNKNGNQTWQEQLREWCEKQPKPFGSAGWPMKLENFMKNILVDQKTTLLDKTNKALKHQMKINGDGKDGVYWLTNFEVEEVLQKLRNV